MENNNSYSNSLTSQFSKQYLPLQNANEVLKTSIYSDYGQGWLVDEPKTFQELGENSLKLRYLEKSLKSKRRLEQRNNQTDQIVDEETNERYKYDKNAVIAKKFPFTAEEFKYPHDGNQMTKTIYTKSSDIYGIQKPTEMEIPNKYHPINNEFTRGFTSNYKNSSLNTAQSKSKVHSALDSVV